MNRQHLKNYMASYGEISFLKDISSILQELGYEWSDFGDKKLGFAFSDAATGIAEITSKLENFEKEYIASTTPVSQKIEQAKLELSSLLYKIENMSLLSLIKKRKEIVQDIKRIEHLKKYINDTKNME